METDELAALVPSWTLHLRAERKTEGTLKTYLAGVTPYLAWCGDRDPLARGRLQEWTAELLENGSSPATAKTRMMAVRHFTRWLADEGEIPEDPFSRVRAPKVDEPVVPVLSEDQLRALVKACAAPVGECTGLPSLRHRRDEAIVRLLAETGLRAGECIALTVADVDLVTMECGRPPRQGWQGSPTCRSARPRPRPSTATCASGASTSSPTVRSCGSVTEVALPGLQRPVLGARATRRRGRHRGLPPAHAAPHRPPTVGWPPVAPRPARWPCTAGRARTCCSATAGPTVSSAPSTNPRRSIGASCDFLNRFADSAGVNYTGVIPSSRESQRRGLKAKQSEARAGASQARMKPRRPPVTTTQRQIRAPHALSVREVQSVRSSTPSPEASAWGKIGAHLSWANTKDRPARTANARAGFEQRFLDEADGDPVRAAHLRKAYFQRLALKSAAARRTKRAAS